MKNIHLPTTKNGVNNLRVLAREVYGREISVNTVYTRLKPNRYTIGDATGPGLLPGELAELLISVIAKQNPPGSVTFTRGTCH